MPKPKPKPTKRPNTDLTGHCHKCKKPVTKDVYCHGCKEYICDDCDVSCGNTPMGPHNVEDHYIDPDSHDHPTDEEMGFD